MIKDGKLVVTWCIHDVVCKAREMNIQLTDSEAAEILEITDRRHDASDGITWDVIGCHIESYVNEG